MRLNLKHYSCIIEYEIRKSVHTHSNDSILTKYYKLCINYRVSRPQIYHMILISATGLGHDIWWAKLR